MPAGEASITAASGAVGSEVLAALRAAGVPVRTLGCTPAVVVRWEADRPHPARTAGPVHGVEPSSGVFRTGVGARHGPDLAPLRDLSRLDAR